ncbi:unnamed protein product [Malus baccata var. baccata]
METFFRLLEEADQDLWPECKEFKKLEVVVRLYQIKCLVGMPDEIFTTLLDLIKRMLPEGDCLSESCYKAKKLINDLGLTYVKIDACPNDCMIYWKDTSELTVCSVCGESRYKITNAKDSSRKKIAAKHTAEHMKWHATECPKDEFMRHPSDSPSWKHLDNLYLDFALEIQNVRLGLARPCSLGKEIDVYMRPLIDELNELWEVGTPTYDDSYSNQSFTMKAAVLWTISDFPAYGMLSGWSTHGYKACPHCMHDNESIYLPASRKICYMGHRRFLEDNHRFRRQTINFNGRREHYSTPRQWIGLQCLEELSTLRFTFGKPKKNASVGQCRKRTTGNTSSNELSAIFRQLCCKKEFEEGFKQLNSRIALTLCQLEKIFTPAFFDIMVHLPVHLADEAALAGSVQYRWMYPIKRYLQMLKRYVRNKDRHRGENVEFDLNVLDQCHRYILNNCDEVNQFRRVVSRYKSHIVHGFKFRIKFVDDKHKNQNCGVFVPANVPGAIGQVNCYGGRGRAVMLFKCEWVNSESPRGMRIDQYGFTMVNFNRLGFKEDPFILASQALQAFYVEDTIEKDWHVVVRMHPRDLFDVLEDSDAIQDYAVPNLDDQILDHENFHTRVGVE